MGISKALIKQAFWVFGISLASVMSYEVTNKIIVPSLFGNKGTSNDADTTYKFDDYVSPKIGEGKIVKSDTIFEDDRKTIHGILYKDDEGKVRVSEYYSNGELFDSEVCHHYEDGGARMMRYRDKKIYAIDVHSPREDGSVYRRIDFIEGHPDCISTAKFDKDRNIIMCDPYNTNLLKDDRKTFPRAEISYNKDGGKTVIRGPEGAPKTITKYDKNDKVLEEKVFDKFGIVSYTVKPKYNKDGTIAKNDTIENKEI